MYNYKQTKIRPRDARVGSSTLNRPEKCSARDYTARANFYYTYITCDRNVTAVRLYIINIIASL